MSFNYGRNSCRGKNFILLDRRLMKLNRKRKWLIIQQYIIGWILAFVFLSIVRGEGTEELGSVQFELGKSMIVSFFGGIIFGSISGYAQLLTEERGYNAISIQRLLIYRTLYVILFLCTIVVLAYLLFGQNISFLEFAFEPGSFAIYLYIVVVDIFMFCFRQINLFFGSNNLWKLFSGKFYSPHEEERILMFLDLQSSTSHAERLGHIQYSKLIQDCFNDLGVVVENAAEIYQYVGDEVVLSWNMTDGLNDQNCVKAYFKFRDQILSRTDYYHSKYDCLPYFKAGINAGIVTVAEVGKYKKEIAYHGDTINTASRIQGMCNSFEKDLIISESLKDRLSREGFEFEGLGSIELKGKQKTVYLYAVEELDKI